MKSISILLSSGIFCLSGLLFATDASLTISDFSSRFTENPIGYLNDVGSKCAIKSNETSDICQSIADVKIWSAQYDNEKIEIVPRSIVRLPPTNASFHRAAKAIALQASGRRIVMINEVHEHSETLILPYKLLAPLRDKGFKVLAVEALAESWRGSESDPSVTYAAGYYTRGPIFADLIRAALKLGYHVVSYDNIRPGESVAQREQCQAESLAGVLKKYPNENMFVLAGMAHVYKTKGSYLEGSKPMAMRLKELTGITPFVIDQIYTFDKLNERENEKQFPRTPGIYVAQTKNGIWSAEPGQFDVSVFSVIDRSASARNAWAGSLFGLRSHVSVLEPSCQNKDCVALAIPVNTSGQEVPSDIVFFKNIIKASLFLPPGKYQIYTRDVSGGLLAHRVEYVP